MDSEALRGEVEALGPWYQCLDLGHGVLTNPGEGAEPHPRARWRALAPFVPDDLSGRSVLDIGCNAGFFAFEARRRGADPVVGIDTDTAALRQARFASRALGLDAEFRELSVYELDALGRTFDFVFFLGVLYHLRHPLLGLDAVSRVCAGTVYVQSVVRGHPAIDVSRDLQSADRDVFLEPGFPGLSFIEHRMDDDATNWWVPNEAGLLAMLRSAGFAHIDRTANEEIFVCRKATG